MKRTGCDVQESSNKRVKYANESPNFSEIASILHDPTRLLYATDLKNLVEATGHIRGRIIMRWPHHKKQHVLLEIMESSVGDRLVKVDVYFQGKCAEELAERDTYLEVHDEIVLGLRGVTVEKKAQASSTSFGLMLKYSDGVTLELVKRRHAHQPCGIVDTWTPLPIPNIPASQDWFEPPQDTREEVTRQNRAQLAGIPVLAPRNEEELDPTTNTPAPNRIEIKSESFEPSIEQISAVTVDHSRPQRSHVPLPETAASHAPVQMVEQHVREPSPAPAPEAPAPHAANGQQPLARPVVSNAEEQAPNTAPQEPVELSKRQIKRRDWKERQIRKREEESARLAALESVKDKPQVSTSSTPAETRNTPPVHAPIERVVPVEQVPAGPLDMKAGRKTRYVTFPPLVDAKSLCTVAGIITNATPINATRSGELSCTLGIVDPSNCKKEDDTYRDPHRASMKVVCFAKKEGHWLPQPQPGDVVILADVKASAWHGGVNLIGSNFKLRWAIYSPEEGKIHHGAAGEAGLCGSGAFSPFYKVRDEGEVRYCKELAKWWKAIEEEQRSFNSRIIHLGGEESHQLGPPIVRSGRPNWAIKDIHSGGESNGYFNTTVEVVHCYKPDSQPYYCLYVTDYTENDALDKFVNDGVHISLSQSIARLECWDKSANVAAQMEVGHFISLNNVRCRLNNNGTYELKMQEPKLRLLSEIDAKYDKAFTGLLERKKAHEEKYGTNDPSEIEHRPVQDAVEGKHFSAVVEIIHREPFTPESRKLVLYVTDYTTNSLLSGTRLPAGVPSSLDGKVLKLALYDAHVQLSKHLKVGDIVSVCRMRITKNHTDGMSVKLGGEEHLLKRLVPGTDAHKDLIEGLRRNKETWKNLCRPTLSTEAEPPRGLPAREPLTPTTPSTEDNLPLAGPLRSRSGESSTATTGRPRYTPIDEVQKVEACPTKFRIRARVTDFYPSVNQFVYSRCRKCDRELTEYERACRECNDTDHEYVDFRYRFWLVLEDETGTQLDVSVIDDCQILSGFPRIDLTEDSEASGKVRERFHALAGNVEAYVADNEKGQDTQLDSPYLVCIVVSYLNAEKEKLYSLYSVDA
ncbi:hypothetical protein PQX77_000342 [Marasmius sp. AFHP31]|nr:hypothetical protein PQX77_000342 [Marasmius sp. AFHP31]